jgi:hypothetical protein
VRFLSDSDPVCFLDGTALDFFGADLVALVRLTANPTPTEYISYDFSSTQLEPELAEIYNRLN